MKRISKVLTVVMLMALSLFVSCDNGMQVSDGTASVRFASGTEDGNARSLSRVNPVFNADDLYWMYTAEKVDNSGLSTGEVSTPTKVGADGKLTSSVGPFSLGDWEFTLYAYTDSAFENLAYKGSTTARLVKSDSGNSVSVTVSALKTSEGKGYIAFPAKGGISLTDSNGHAVESYDEFITITNIENSVIAVNGVKNSEERVFEVASGAYKVTVAYCDVNDDNLKYGENSIYVNVWDNLTTTIGGSLDEITSDTTFNPFDGTTTFNPSDGTVEASVKATISAGSETEITVASSPANLDSTGSTEKTTVEIPAGATDAGSATLTVTPYTIDKIGEFTFETEEGKTIVGGLDLKLVVGDTTVSKFNEAVTVTTYIAKGLSNVTVKYNGEESQPTDISYVAGTGELTFKTTHFSEFYITTSSVVFNKNKGEAYLSIDDAISCADSGDEIMLLNDIKEDITITGKNVTIMAAKSPVVEDAFGRAIASNNLNEFVTFDGTFIIKSGSLTLKNLILVNTTEKKKNISIEGGGVQVKLDNTLVKTAINGRAIDALIPEEGKDSQICISMNSSSIEMYTGQNDSQQYGRARGINIDIHDNSESYEKKLSNAKISITDSTLLDKTEGTYSVMPFQIFRTDVVDINIDNTQIFCEKNHYAIRLYEVGSMENKSTVNIINSYLKGYAAYYNQYVTNICTNISSSTVIGENKNDGESSGFSAISLQYPVSSEIEVIDSKILVNQLGSSDQRLAELSYVLDNSYCNNSISFKNCTVELNNKLEEGRMRLYCLENAPDSSITNNRLIFDDATLNNILGQEYELFNGDPVDYDGIYSINTYIQAQTEL